ncbi:MAG TPA: dihydrolipoyllysine-residue succinyltransferase [Chthoniobacterales bacterium]
MSFEVKVPAVGESITTGVISAWHKKDGESITSGEVLFTLETDKISTEVTAQESGIVKLQAAEGEEVKIGQTVAVIEAAGAAPAPKAEEKPPVPEAAPAPAPESAPVLAPAPVAEAPKPEPPAPKAATVPDDARTTRKRLTPLRRKIATQLVAAQQTAAILTTFNECDMSAVMQLRKELQEEFQKKHGVKLGFMSFFIKAAVDALKAVPGINSRLDGDELVTNHYHDIGVAVGTEKGLIVPVLRDCDAKSFAELEGDLGAYAVKAREGKIGIEDLQGGVFTISNGGVYGSLLSTPILNPPQSGILGLHKIQERPMAVKGQVVIRPMMYLALSYDHRVVDGKEAVTFLVRVKDCIENPARLLLGA